MPPFVQVDSARTGLDSFIGRDGFSGIGQQTAEAVHPNG